MKITPAHGWFACGATFAAAAWIGLWPPREGPRNRQITDPRREITAGPAEPPISALSALEAAETSQRKLAAAMRLNEIPPEGIPAMLESMELLKNRQLTFAARALFTRWGSKDGSAAMKWAWQHLGTGPGWNEAFREIGPAWAWRDPEGLGAWVKESLERRRPEIDLPADQVASFEQPALDFNQVSNALRWLVSGKPSVAFDILKNTPSGYRFYDSRLEEMLRTVEQVREALTVFDKVESIEAGNPRPDQSVAYQLLSRWRELDPGDFARSRYRTVLVPNGYQDLDDAVGTWKTVSPGERAAAADVAIGVRSGVPRDYALSKITKEWVAADPAGAADWLESLPAADAVARDRIYAAEISLADPPRAFRRIASLPPVAARVAMTAAFDAWRLNRPGERPEMTGWNESQRQVWKDLSGLKYD